MSLTVHPQALGEGIAARRWFQQYSEASGRRFSQALDHAIALLLDSPLIGSPIGAGYRRLRLHGYRYVVIYYVAGHDLTVVAIAHASRRPGYWVGRR